MYNVCKKITYHFEPKKVCNTAGGKISLFLVNLATLELAINLEKNMLLANTKQSVLQMFIIPKGEQKAVSSTTIC